MQRKVKMKKNMEEVKEKKERKTFLTATTIDE